MVKYGQNFDYKVIPMGPAYNQVSWSSFTKDQSINQLIMEVFVEQPLALHWGPLGALGGLHGSMGGLLTAPLVLLIVQDHFHYKY